MVAPDGDVQNRVIFTAQDYTQNQLVEASNYLTAHYAGPDHRAGARAPEGEVDEAARRDRGADAGRGAGRQRGMADSQEQVVISGERNLLTVQDLGSDMGSFAQAVRPVRAQDRS